MSSERSSVRTLALGRRGALFYRSIRSAMFAFGQVRYCSERRFPAAMGLRSYLRRHRIDQVLMPNAYGNPWRLACYRRLRADGFPTIVCDRGALPGSWFFDEGFLADSAAYSPERWDRALTDGERARVRGYLAELRASDVALERQGPRTDLVELRRAAGVSRGERVLFVPLQRPHDTAVRFFAGARIDHAGFEAFVSELAVRLAEAPEPWVVLVKQHPLEDHAPRVEGVRVAPDDAHVHDLLESADATLVLTSGVGLLSLAFGKPTFHAGRAFYGGPGLSRPVGSAADAFAKIVAARPPDADRVERFVHHLRTRVYSFGDSRTRLTQDARGRRLRVTDHIDFDELRVLGRLHDVDKPRVLVLSPIAPWPAERGSAARLDAMLRSLIDHGAAVSLCAMISGSITDQEARASLRERYPEANRVEVVPHPGRGARRVARELLRVGVALSGGLREISNLETCPPAFRRRVASLIAETQPTHLLVNYAKLTPAVPDDFDGVAIVDTHDCQTRLVEESQRYAGTRKFVSISRHRESEREALSRYDRVVAINPDEARTFSAWAPAAEVVFIPHFTAAAPLAAISLEEAAYDAFFVGSGSSFNVLGLVWFLERVLPRVRHRLPGYRFAAVGEMTADPRIPARLRRDATLLGRVEDLERIYRRGRVATAPIQAGAGMKTKVVEALAMRRPVVCTRLAADGIALEHRRSAWLADDPGVFAEGLIALHEDPALWERLAAGGSLLHAREHSHDAVAPRIKALLRPALGAKRSAP